MIADRNFGKESFDVCLVEMKSFNNTEKCISSFALGSFWIDYWGFGKFP